MIHVYRTAPDLVTRKVGDEAVIVPIRNRVGDLESVFTLNEVAPDRRPEHGERDREPPFGGI
jgi:hypothetical protein